MKKKQHQIILKNIKQRGSTNKQTHKTTCNSIMHNNTNGNVKINRQWIVTCDEADPPEAGVQSHLDLGGLVLLQHDSLLHQQPVVRRHGDAHQQQTAGPKNRREQRQSPRTERTHLRTGSKRVQSTCRGQKRSGKHAIHVLLQRERRGDDSKGKDWFNLSTFTF